MDDALTLTDVFTIPLEEGNFIQTVDSNVVGNETQASSGVWFLRITPLTPGRHELVFSDDIEGVGVFDVTPHHGAVGERPTRHPPAAHFANLKSAS